MGGGWDGVKGQREENGMEGRDSGRRMEWSEGTAGRRMGWSEGTAGGGWDGVKGQREEDRME